MRHTVILYFFFFFNDTATTEIYTLSLHDALPISERRSLRRPRDGARRQSRAAQESRVREAHRCGGERGLRRWRARTPALDRRPGGGAARAFRPAPGPLVDLSLWRRDTEAGPADPLR